MDQRDTPSDPGSALLHCRFGQVHRVYDLGENGQAWIADPGLAGARSLRDVVQALRPRLYIAEIAWSHAKWCVELSACDPKTGRPIADRRSGITPVASKPLARKLLRAWALLLAGKFDGPDAGNT